jgi:cytochrome o ubiquinol oxidase operon protein cyoD
MIRSYVIGFVASLSLTLVAFGCVYFNILSGMQLLIVIGLLAIVQAIIQLNYFLHLGSEAKPRLRLMTFLFMFLILIIIVGGSIWIMHNLNYNMMQMTPEQKDYYMNSQRDKGF